MVRVEKLVMQGFKSFAGRVEVPFPSGFTIVCGPNGSGKSVRADTEILLTDGSINPIGEMIEFVLNNSKNIKKLDDGVYTNENPEKWKVWGLDQKTMKIVEKKISAFVRRNGEPHLFEITTGIGKRVATTGCHPVMVFRYGKIISEVVDKLKEGDMIATPRRLEFPENKFKIGNLDIDEDFSRFVGYLIGDGYTTLNRIEIVNAEKIILDDFEYLAKKLGLVIKYKKQTGKATRLICWSKEFPLTMKKLLKSDSVLHLTSKYKIIPSEILMSKKSILSNFLAALFDCDATVRKDNPTFEYTTKNEKLADQVQLAFLRFGIVARKRKTLKHATNTKEKTKREYFDIVVEGKEKMKLIYENIPMISKMKVDRLKNHAAKDIKTGSNLDILPQETNVLVKKCTKLLGIEYKPMRKRYPWFAAYNENRCCPTRSGAENALCIFREKYNKIKGIRSSLSSEKNSLLSAMKIMNIKKTHASSKIGLNKDTINNSWVFLDHGGKKENREKLYEYIKSELDLRMKESQSIMNVLESLAKSDIFWDRIKKIDKVRGEKWVYDLTIQDCHNFIGNGIFVHNSNIIDAITFVLGVTSARAIRAQKLEKLIFNGARNKKPAPFCEVSLVLDNSDKQMPGDDDVVTITRRVTRSGVSIYRINEKTVNKTKLIDTLAYANLSPDGYNIIMQGDVTRIIEMSPKQRREIIDDISGITEFNEKKEDTMRKLEKVESRVRESMIIIVEKQKRVEQLKKEKEEAERYLRLNDELKRATASSIHHDIKQYEQEKELLKQTADESKSTFTEIDRELKRKEKELESKEKLFKHKSEEIIETRSFDTIRDIEKTNSEILRKRDRIISIEREISFMSKGKRDFSGKLPVKVNKFSSLISTDNKYGMAIEVAMASHIDDFVIDTDDHAVECIEYLKRTRIGRARFLPLNKIKGGRIGKRIDYKGFLGLAIDLVKFDYVYNSAIEYVLGKTLVFDTIDNAKRVSGYRIVTLEGELIEKSGAIIGGHRERRVFNTAGLEQEKERILNEIDMFEEHMVALKKQKEQEDKKFADTKEQKSTLDQELDEMKKAVKDLTQQKFAIHSKMNKDQTEHTRIEVILSDLGKKFREYKDVELLDIDKPELQRKISYCILEIRKLGHVNVKSIEEYASISTEFEQMKSKLDSLIEEKNSIIKTIEEIETKRQEKFKSTLELLAKNFTQIYYDMVGGTGHIRLEDENNIDSGLVIESSPAGTRVLDLDVMSGGEKTMASLSFLFAILQHYSSPFYVLDEVDAALDKINTKKVANLVKKYSKKIQFIVISHDDITISAADKVFGIAKQDGVSKVFGIDLPTR
ncbi:MAG: AAA family ATPase [Candidatus Aenigmarchaeota archaeon]|nr:AAA family ATPase [Candidatus Aenigmarchaeota archaeon]